MSPQTPYWIGFHKVLAELEATGKASFFITSFDEFARAPTCEVSLRNAAKCIFEKSHRLSTEAEIGQFHADQRSREALCVAATDRSERRRNLALPSGILQELLGDKLVIVTSEDPEPEKGKVHEFPAVTDRAS